MTDFKQEVLSAIEERWVATAPRVFPADDAVQRACQQIREALASDVAAALQTVIGTDWSSPAFRREAENAALKVLRGEWAPPQPRSAST